MKVSVGILLGSWVIILLGIWFYNIKTDAPTRKEQENRQFRVKQKVNNTIIAPLRTLFKKVVEKIVEIFIEVVILIVFLEYLLPVIAPDVIPWFSMLFSSGIISL